MLAVPEALFSNGAPGRIRTHDLDVRTVLLYPLSYRRMQGLLYNTDDS